MLDAANEIDPLQLIYTSESSVEWMDLDMQSCGSPASDATCG